MTGSHDDQSLIEQCRAGKTEAFGTLVKRYQDRLYPTVLRLCGGAEEDADDLLQDAFLRAFEQLGRFPRGEFLLRHAVYRRSPSTWLPFSDRRKRRVPGRVAPATGGDTIDSADLRAPTDPALPLLKAERDEQVQRALDALAPEFRAVVVLTDYDGLRYEEIADVLRIPIGTVRSRLHRARGELRERLRGVIDRPPAPAEAPALIAPAARLLAPHASLDAEIP